MVQNGGEVGGILYDPTKGPSYRTFYAKFRLPELGSRPFWPGQWEDLSNPAEQPKTLLKSSNARAQVGWEGCSSFDVIDTLNFIFTKIYGRMRRE